MDKLIISLKKSNKILEDFKKAFHKAKKGKLKKPHYEISFDNKKDFDRFVRNLDVMKYHKNRRVDGR